MSQQALEAVIGRAILDEEFRLALFADPEAALAGYELTEVEVAALRSVDAESLDACGSIGQRIRLGHFRSDANARVRHQGVRGPSYMMHDALLCVVHDREPPAAPVE